MRPPGFRGAFRTDDDARAVYAESAGIGRIVPRAVAVPADPDDVVALVRWAASRGEPLIARGSGSSMANGAIGDGVMVDLSRLKAIGAVDVERRRITVGPGAIWRDVDAAARAVGLRHPVDPSSGAFCTVGGMAATNAAGAHSLAFGSMRRWVRSIDCVLADGSRVTVTRGEAGPARLMEAFGDATTRERWRALRHAGVRKESSGYALAEYAESGDLVDILIGSEGTLALFVGLELSLTAAAAATSSVLASFATLEDAAAAATRAAAAGAVACELLDRTFLELVAASSPHSSAEAVLLAEVEGASAADAVERARRLAETFTAQGATSIDLARDEAAEVELWSLRHAASPLLARLGPALRSMQFIEDGAVPPSRLPEYVRGVRAALDRQEIRGVIFGHAGDAHVHVNPLVETSRADWRARVGLLLDEVTSLVASLGGTVAGEHGDGRLRTPLMDRVWSREAMVEFARVKRAFDPHGILNPGVKVPGAGGSAELAIKYDPALPAPPAAAAAALRRVETERAYAADRLQLLEDAAPMP